MRMRERSQAVSRGADPLDAVLAHLVDAAEAATDREVCGFVVAAVGGRSAEVIPLRNRAGEPVREFRLDPGEVLAVLRRVEREGLWLVALYHSHPGGGSVLSPRDFAELTLDGRPLLPGVELWVIGMHEGRTQDLRAYRWADGAYSEVARRQAPADRG
jgi:proteasome lid subunit RPN8/RPN11